VFNIHSYPVFALLSGISWVFCGTQLRLLAPGATWLCS